MNRSQLYFMCSRTLYLKIHWKQKFIVTIICAVCGDECDFEVQHFVVVVLMYNSVPKSSSSL